jgi:hypothetical protein
VIINTKLYQLIQRTPSFQAELLVLLPEPRLHLGLHKLLDGAECRIEGHKVGVADMRRGIEYSTIDAYCNCNTQYISFLTGRRRAHNISSAECFPSDL